MNPKLLFLTEFCKLIGRLGDAAARNDTRAFLNILRLIKETIATVEKGLTFRVVDPNDDTDDDEL